VTHHPIHTAPRDGTVITFVYDGGSEVEVQWGLCPPSWEYSREHAREEWHLSGNPEKRPPDKPLGWRPL
jgi:hypothetical protein